MPPVASWWPAYVGLGSNLDDPPQQLARAFDALARLPETRLVLRSGCYRTAPFGPVIQPHFLNAVAGLLTRLAPDALLEQLRAIEQAQGRAAVRERWGPRPIDLDLLVHGLARRSDPALTLPHPGIPERNFVLYPLRDLAPDLDIPGLGTVRELAARVTAEGIERHVPATGAMTTT